MSKALAYVECGFINLQKKRRVLRRLILHTYIIYDTYLLILVTEKSCVVKDIRGPLLKNVT